MNVVCKFVNCKYCRGKFCTKPLLSLNAFGQCKIWFNDAGQWRGNPFYQDEPAQESVPTPQQEEIKDDADRASSET